MRTSSPDHQSEGTAGTPSRRHRVRALSTALVLSAAAAVAPVTAAAPASAADPTTTTVDRVFRDTRITESSGLAISTRRSQVLLTHNDSGDRPRLFAVGTAGRTKAVLTLRGASAHDWEDIATGPGKRVWVGDIGDNARSRSDISVYRATEPATLSTGTIDATRFRLRYPDRARDAEALMVHPTTGRLYVVTKSDHSAGIYEAPAQLSSTGVNMLRRVASAPASVTAAAFAPDGSHFVLGTYTAAYLYADLASSPMRVRLPARAQGESLAVTAEGRLLIGSEGRRSRVLSVANPFRAPTTQPGTAQPGTTQSGTTQSGTTQPGTTQPGTQPTGDLAGWNLDLQEDFDVIDPARWTVRNNTSNANEDSYLLARNVTAKDGILRIQGKKESAGGRSYTSGYLDTNRTYALPNYFRAEIRAKVPMEQGMWAAPLWFRPADFSGGEIDLIETYGRDRRNPIVHQTIHTDYGSSHQKKGSNYDFADLGDPTGTQWHTYTVEKTAGRIVMWVDGVRTATFGTGDPSWFDRYYEAGKRWNLRINLQIGGDWGRLPDSTTDWSADKTAMQVDYLRTWTRR